MLEQEHVRKILASAAALKGETIQSEWNEDDDDFSDVDSNEDGKDQDCPQEPGWTIVDAGVGNVWSPNSDRPITNTSELYIYVIVHICRNPSRGLPPISP